MRRNGLSRLSTPCVNSVTVAVIVIRLVRMMNAMMRSTPTPINCRLKRVTRIQPNSKYTWPLGSTQPWKMSCNTKIRIRIGKPRMMPRET